MNFDKLNELLKKYESNEYMLQRLNLHVSSILPNTLEMELAHYNERTTRTNTLQTVQETFIRVFLDKNKYYYLSSSGLYYEYIDNSYCVRKEDDIIHKLLTTISEDRTLMDWKYKTKFNIIRRIKDRNLLSSSTPNTETIQRILNVLHPTFFPSKNTAKYFLTVIGDNILKKQTNIRIIHKYAQTFAEIDNLTPLIGATNLTANFVSKYNDNHNYAQYRLLQANDQIISDTWYNMVASSQLDLLCVATYYSNRYGSSDQFIEQHTEDCMRTHVLYFQNNSQEQIISQFITHSTQPATDTTFSISWKQLHYIWKQYLSINVLPNMMYSNTLKQHLKQHLLYDESSDTFLNLTSKYLPNISHFLQFWSENVSVSVGDGFIQELELGELYSLYASSTMKETEMFKLIQHFYPETKIDEYKYNKYILHIECKLWNKQEEIINVLESHKQKTTGIISIDELYTEYITNIDGKLIASKQYFEKYIRHHFKDSIVYETFLNFNV